MDLNGIQEENAPDESLIRWMLSLKPDERLQVLEDFVNAVLEIRQENAS